LKFPSKDADLSISNPRIAAVLVFAILNLVVFFLRAASVWHYGSLFTMQGGEAAAIYPVWKGVHHLSVYAWPFRFPFTLALYNYLFYYTYAFFLRLVGAQGADIMTWGRVPTVAFVLVGAIAQWRLVRKYLNLHGALSILSLFFSVALWVSSSMVRGYALSMRPDIAAVALVMVALWMVVRQPRFGFAYAGIVFYLAWSFKETAVLAFVGVCLYLLFQRRWRDLSMLAAVFALLAAATLMIGTPEYRFNILVAPRLVKEFSVRWALQMAPKSILANAYWILAPIALLIAARARRVDGAIRMLITVFAVALVGGLVGMTKQGAWDNYLLEAFVAGSTLLQMAVFAAPGRFVSALVLFACVQPGIQLVTAPNGSHPHTFGTVGIATAAEYADAVALRDRLEPMKKPIFTPDPTFSLPWLSNDNHPDALIIDSIFHEATRTNCANGCIEGMLQRGEIPTVMLASSGDIYQSSLNPRYEKVGDAVYTDRHYSIYVLNPRVPATQPLVQIPSK